MSDAIVQQLPVAGEPYPTERPAPFLGATGEGQQDGEAENVEAALILVESHRRLWCVHYDSCLELAVGAGWHGWSCAACPLAAAPPPCEPVWRSSGAVASH
jgi:hypothetical protein